MVKDDPLYEIDVDAPSAGFGVAAEVLGHKNNVMFLTCWCVMELMTPAWTEKPIRKMMVVTSDSIVELMVIDLELLLRSQMVRAHLGSWDL